MSAFFFGRKTPEITIEQLAAIEGSERKDASATKAAYNAMVSSLTNLREVDMEKLPRRELWQKVRTQRIADFEILMVALNKVDPNRLLPEDIDVLKTAVYTKAADGALICAKEALEHWGGPGRYTSYAKSTLQEAHSLIQQVIRKQFDPDYAKPQDAGADVDLSSIPFPHQSFENAELSQALRTLEKAWKSATKHPTSIEDRYLLEQIVTSWLPESWSLIRGFETYSDQLRQRVEANVLEQLNLITEQVQELLDRNQQTFLGRLEAHTQFLRERRRNQTSGNLSLSRGEDLATSQQELADTQLELEAEPAAQIAAGDSGSELVPEAIDVEMLPEPEENKTLTFMKQAW